MSAYDWRALGIIGGYVLGYALSVIVGILGISTTVVRLKDYLVQSNESSSTSAPTSTELPAQPGQPNTSPGDAPQDAKSAQPTKKVADRYQRIATIAGSIEVVMYTTSILVGHPEFIGVWLVLKAVGEWRQGLKAPEGANALIGASGEYAIFLIGNALNVILAAITAALLHRFVPPFPTFSH